MDRTPHGSPRVVEISGHQVRITSPDKPAFPGLTKADVIDYYFDVADRMITHLHGRPTALERWPDGVFEGSQSFYQKHVPKALPSFVHAEVIRFPSGRPGTMIAPTDPAAIIWAAQMNAVTFHPWPCSAPALDRPDQLRLDFDPSPGTGFDDAVRVAVMARELLGEWGWPAFCKTSGGRGVHVYVPIEPEWSFIDVRHAAIAIGRELERLEPSLITTSWWKEDRGPRVFIDFNQAAQDRTMASAYSIRANAAATVSMPVTWEELTSCQPTDFTVRTVPDLCRSGLDPWSGMAGQAVRLDEALERWNRDAAMGLPELPYPPDFPKMPGEPTRVQPSRARQSD